MKNSDDVAETYARLIDAWIGMSEREQVTYVEAIEQLSVNKDLGNASVRIAKEAMEKLCCDTSRAHVMLFVGNKFLTLYSSQTALALTSADVLFSTILMECKKRFDVNSTVDLRENSIETFQVLLAGSETNPKCIPHVAHVKQMKNGMTFVCFIEVGRNAAASNLYDCFINLHNLETVQIHRDAESLKPKLEDLDTSIKKLIDNLKKIKGTSVESKYKTLVARWDFMRKNYWDYVKTRKEEAICRAEANGKSLLDLFREILRLLFRDAELVKSSGANLEAVEDFVIREFELYEDFFKVKALKNFTLGSYPFFCKISSFYFSFYFFIIYFIILYYSYIRVPNDETLKLP